MVSGYVGTHGFPEAGRRPGSLLQRPLCEGPPEGSLERKGPEYSLTTGRRELPSSRDPAANPTMMSLLEGRQDNECVNSTAAGSDGLNSGPGSFTS